MIYSFLQSVAQINQPDNCDSGCLTNLPEVEANDSTIESLMTVVFGIVGALAVVSLMIASINYVTGGNDPDKLSRAKNTIIYSLVGVAIAVTGQALVLTLLGKL